jgi:hypothetical protein
MTSESSTHRSQATSGLEPNIAHGICGTRGCGAYLGIDAPDPDVRSNMPIRLSRGTSCIMFAGSTVRLPLYSERTSPTVAHGEPASGEWPHSPCSVCRVAMLPFSVWSNSALDSRHIRHAMLGFSPGACSRMCVATSRGTRRRRSYGHGPCWGFSAPRSRIRHTRAQWAAHAERVPCLSGHAGDAIVSRSVSNRTHEAGLPDIAGGQPRQSMLSKGDGRTALHAAYNSARLMRNV